MVSAIKVRMFSYEIMNSKDKLSVAHFTLVSYFLNPESFPVALLN